MQVSDREREAEQGKEPPTLKRSELEEEQQHCGIILDEEFGLKQLGRPDNSNELTLTEVSFHWITSDQ